MDFSALLAALNQASGFELYRLRVAIDRVLAGAGPFRVEPAWMAELNKVSEGQSHTLGAYYRPWK